MQPKYRCRHGNNPEMLFVTKLLSYQMARSHSGRNPRLLRNNPSLSFSTRMPESCTNSQTPDAKEVRWTPDAEFGIS